MKASDLREKSIEDLKELGRSRASDVFQNRLKNFTNRLDDTSAIRKSKRDHARVITLLRERELGVVRANAPAASPSKASLPADRPSAAAGGAKASKKAAPKAETKSGSAAESTAGGAESAKPKKAPAKKAAAKKSEAK